jgi:hypothetical protein
MKNFVCGVVATPIVFTFAGWLYLKLGYADLRANLPPSWLESQLATMALNASVARRALPQQNPIAFTETSAPTASLYSFGKCACHLDWGKGTRHSCI